MFFKDFAAGVFSSFGGKAARRTPPEILCRSSRFYTTKIRDIFLQTARANRASLKLKSQRVTTYDVASREAYSRLWWGGSKVGRFFSALASARAAGGSQDCLKLLSAPAETHPESLHVQKQKQQEESARHPGRDYARYQASPPFLAIWRLSGRG